MINKASVSVCLLLFPLCSFSGLFAQPADSLQWSALLCADRFYTAVDSPSAATDIQFEKSELTAFSQLSVKFYQEYISSQQYNVCYFSPSCSHFGQESLRKTGLIRAVLLTADRLQRCNPFTGHYDYGFDAATNKFVDSTGSYLTK